MLDIQILSRKEARRFSYEPHNFKTAIISITDTNKSDVIFEKNDFNRIRAILKLKFDDVEEEIKFKEETNIVKWKEFNEVD